MADIRICRDLEEARRLWQAHWPRESLFDLWPVRSCFQMHYDREPWFIVVERQGGIEGLVALSWIPEEAYFGHFPGEVWHGKTWLEQNRILSTSSEVFERMVANIPGTLSVRYLNETDALRCGYPVGPDEIGYLFYPAAYAYSYQTYLQAFPGKTRKKILKDVKRFEKPGVSFRFDCLSDIEWLFRTNLECFQESSYFNDPRFLNSFENLSAWLYTRGMLRVTTLLVGGRVAAVDMGAIWNGTYLVLAGGTNPEFPGVAKVMNLHHIQWACRQRFSSVDFLCGDFNWKSRFRLAMRPLYQLVTPSPNGPLKAAPVPRSSVRAV